jgi:hypothetical protein
MRRTLRIPTSQAWNAPGSILALNRIMGACSSLADLARRPSEPSLCRRRATAEARDHRYVIATADSMARGCRGRRATRRSSTTGAAQEAAAIVPTALAAGLREAASYRLRRPGALRLRNLARLSPPAISESRPTVLPGVRRRRKPRGSCARRGSPGPARWLGAAGPGGDPRQPARRKLRGEKRGRGCCWRVRVGRHVGTGAL